MDFVNKLPIELLSIVFHDVRGHKYDVQQCWCRVNKAFPDLGRMEMFRHPTIGFSDLPSWVLDYIQNPHHRITTMSLRIVLSRETRHIRQPPHLWPPKDQEVRTLTAGIIHQGNLLEDLGRGEPSAYLSLLLIMLPKLKHFHLEGVGETSGLAVNDISILNSLFPEPRPVPSYPSKLTWICPRPWTQGYGEEVLGMIAPKLNTLEIDGSLFLKGTPPAYIQARFAPYLPPFLSLKHFRSLRGLEIPYGALLDPAYGTPMDVQQLPATLKYLRIVRVPIVNALTKWLKALVHLGCAPELRELECQVDVSHLEYAIGVGASLREVAMLPSSTRD
jgi:hypothetical protein